MSKIAIADTIAVAHLAYVLFIVLGLAAILLGLVCRWRWVRNFYFRVAHLTAIGIVAVEEMLRVQCPLTTWERALRAEAGQTVADASFMARLANAVLFRPLEPWVFVTAHLAFAGLVLLTFILAPPRWPFRRESRAPVPHAHS
jgi:hypothetical protein